MTILLFTGWEGGIAPAGNSNGGGTFSIQSGVTKNGSYAFRANPTTTAVGWTEITGQAATGASSTGAISVATAYYTFWFKALTLPAALKEQMAEAISNSGAKLTLYISSAGLLSVHDRTNTLVETGDTPLSVGTWYQISMQAANGAAAAYEVKIDGTTELSGTCDQAALNCNGIRLGKRVNTNGNTVDFYYDDVVMDGSAYVTDSGVRLLSVDSNGSTQQWTSGTNASDFNEVDEIPADGGTTYVKCGTGGNQVALFGFNSCATAGINGAIKAVFATIIVAEDTNDTSANSLRVRSGGNNYDLTGFNHTTAYKKMGVLHVTDPATSVDWVTAGVDALEVGSIEVNAVAMRLDSVFCEVLFVVPEEEEVLIEAYSLGLPFIFDQRVIGLIP